jgi:hypothetical protein
MAMVAWECSQWRSGLPHGGGRRVGHSLNGPVPAGLPVPGNQEFVAVPQRIGPFLGAGVLEGECGPYSR